MNRAERGPPSRAVGSRGGKGIGAERNSESPRSIFGNALVASAATKRPISDRKDCRFAELAEASPV
jgi:hypothetical protein